MKNKTKYRLGEVEEIVSEMEFEDRCDEIVEVDDDLQLLISGWYVFIPSLSLYLRAGVACVFDEEAGMYMLFQVIGAILGSVILWGLTSNAGLVGTGANVCQEGVSIMGGLLAEVVFTFVFVLVVLGTTDAQKGAGNFAGLAIGLSLVLVHLACIRYTGTSVNPARSIGPALFQGGEALSQLWIFIIGPFIGAALSAGVWNIFAEKKG